MCVCVCVLVWHPRMYGCVAGGRLSLAGLGFPLLSCSAGIPPSLLQRELLLVCFWKEGGGGWSLPTPGKNRMLGSKQHDVIFDG
jgi:hypothetical protein